jgi:hypothetical protein
MVRPVTHTDSLVKRKGKYLVIHKLRWEDNIKMEVWKKELEGLDLKNWLAIRPGGGLL